MLRIIGPATSMSMAVTAYCRRLWSISPAGRFLRQDGDELRRRVEIADQQQILDQRHDRRHHVAPAVVVVLDAQQVEHQRQVERPQDGGRDRRQPRADALRRVVGGLLDVDGPRPRRPRARARTRPRRTTCRCTT